MKKYIIIVLLLTLNLAILPKSFAIPSNAQTKTTIKAWKASYLALGATPETCSNHESALEYQDNIYCFSDKQNVQVKTINNTPFLFLNINSDIKQYAGHASSGLSGLFVFKSNKKDEWQIVAKNPYIENGQWGESQLKDFKLIKIGSEKYGWAGEFFGSGAGGESNSTWTLFAPIGDKILPIIEEETAHDYTGGHWVEMKGNVSILSNRPEVNGYYPIQVTRTEKTAPTNRDSNPIKSKIKTIHENYILVFNGKKFVKK